MKLNLSDAIDLGSLMVKPSPGDFYDEHAGVPRGCALGMAWYAAGCTNKFNTASEDPFPWAAMRHVYLPCGCPYEVSVSSAIAHLFDGHVYGSNDWTLKQLIAWVRSVEPAEKETPATEMKEEVTCNESQLVMQ